MIQNAIKLADVADKLNKSGYVTLGKYAINASEQMTKEAQFNANMWNPKNWGQGIKEKANQWTKGADPKLMTQRFSRILNAVQALRTRFPEDLSSINDPNMEAQAQGAFIELKDNIGKELPILEQMSRKDANAGKMYQQILPAFQNFSKIVATPHQMGRAGQKPRSRRIALDNLANTISQAIGVSNESFQTQIPQQQQQSNPEVAETQLGDNLFEGPQGIEDTTPQVPTSSISAPAAQAGPVMPEPRNQLVNRVLDTIGNSDMNYEDIDSLISQLRLLRERPKRQATSSEPIKQLINKLTKG